jgi:hypothetical protein
VLVAGPLLGLLIAPASAAPASAASPSAASASAAPASAAAPPAAVPSATRGAPVDRRITDARITESSGLTPSLWFPGVLWTHNDSGNPPKIYAIGRNGGTRATLTLLAEPNVDWEAITSLRVPAGTGAPGGPLIAVGDIGDNTGVHPNVRIAIIREPGRLRSGSVRPIRVLRLRYPGGPRDAETLMADPRTGRFYIVSKTLFGADLYAVPASLWPGRAGRPPRVSRVTTLQRVGSIAANFVTDGTFLRDGRMLIRGYGRVYVVAPPESVRDGTVDVLTSAGLPTQDQGESIAVTDGGRQALIGSEGPREPVYRIPVPASTEATPSGSGTDTPGPAAPGAASPGASGSATASPRMDAAPQLTGVGTIHVWVGVIAGGLVLMALTGGVVLFLTRMR